MDDASLQIDLGTVQSGRRGSLSFSYIVRNNGDANLQIYCCDPSDLRKSGVLLTLGTIQYQQLKAIIEKTDQVIDRLRRGTPLRDGDAVVAEVVGDAPSEVLPTHINQSDDEFLNDIGLGDLKAKSGDKE